MHICLSNSNPDQVGRLLLCTDSDISDSTEEKSGYWGYSTESKCQYTEERSMVYKTRLIKKKRKKFLSLLLKGRDRTCNSLGAEI